VQAEAQAGCEGGDVRLLVPAPLDREFARDAEVGKPRLDRRREPPGEDRDRDPLVLCELDGEAVARRERLEVLAARAVDRLRQAGLFSPTLVALAHYIVTRPN